MKNIFIVLFAMCVTASAAQAQSAPTPAAGPVTNPVATSLRTLQPRQEKNILAAIEAMPADKFAYKPTPEQMSFAHLVIHIAESNNGLCAKVADIAPPKVAELKETDAKETLLAAAKASFEFCTAALANLDDSKMGDPQEFFGRFQGPRAMAGFFLVGGWSDHYAAAAMYLRLNGILPPSAQPKK